MITNATKEELEKALKEVNKQYENNIKFKRFDVVKNRIHFTLTVKNSRIAGSRTSASYFHPNRRVAAACWHVHGNFFDALFAINKAIFVRAQSRKITATDGNWQDKQIGPPVYPVMYSEACDCDN